MNFRRRGRRKRENIRHAESLKLWPEEVECDKRGVGLRGIRDYHGRGRGDLSHEYTAALLLSWIKTKVLRWWLSKVGICKRRGNAERITKKTQTTAAN